jgi:glycosyltransferase involved in cell wall biosynthesis
MKNILFITSTLKRSGPINQLYNLIKYLNKEKYKPYIITLSPECKDSRWADYEALGVKLYPLNYSRKRAYFYAQRAVRILLNQINPSLIHTHGIRADIISAKLKTYIPKISTTHSILQMNYQISYGWLLGKLMFMQHIKAMRKLHMCIGVSEVVSNYLKEKCSMRNVITIQNGIDTDIYYPVSKDAKSILRKELGLPLDELIMVYVGHLSKLKDPMFLIENLIKYKELVNTLHLVLIGNGELYAKCRSRVMGNKYIHLIGRINNVCDYLHASDYFVSVSRLEGLPMAVLEALAAGLPVLLSDIESHKEILRFNGDAGICYDIDNEHSFILSLKKMLNNDRDHMAMAALDIIYENLSAQKMSHNYQTLYNSYNLSK